MSKEVVEKMISLKKGDVTKKGTEDVGEEKSLKTTNTKDAGEENNLKTTNKAHLITEPALVISEDTDEQQTPKCVKVCAICCKEEALPDENVASELDQEIEDQKAKMEQKLGRPLKLREQKAIERKVERAIEKEKQRAKEERRRLRDEAMKKGKDDDTRNRNNNHHEDKFPSDEAKTNFAESNYEEEEDEFLKAIGGQSKLLTGEAYQQMLLQKHEEMKELDLNKT